MMIFRWLYKRRVNRLFGPVLPKDAIKQMTGGLSEWQSFKLFLPRRIYRLFFAPVMSETDALQTLQVMIRDALREAPDVSGNEHGVPDSPTKPN